MINIEFNSILELIRAFPNEETCIKHLEQLRWPVKVVSPFDEESTVYVCKGNKYRCRNTGKYFNVRTATLFDNTKVELQKWFLAIWLVTSHKKGISSLQLAKDVNVTQKTAWFMLQRIRNCFGIENTDTKLDGIVEVDETFIGGKAANKSKAIRAKKAKEGGRGYTDKIAVAGFVQRGGKTIVRVIGVANGLVLKPLVRTYLEIGTTLVTDGFGGYKDLGMEYPHIIINHAKDEYAKGIYSTNTVEGFWSLLKRSIYGIYHSVSPKHLSKYVDETTFRYNTRKASESLRFNYLLANSNKRLTYKTLIANA